MSNNKNALELLMNQARQGGTTKQQTRSASTSTIEKDNAFHSNRTRKRSRQESSPIRSPASSNQKIATPASKKESSGGSRFFPCPAGCGAHLTELNVNAHLDRYCSSLGLDSSASANHGDGVKAKRNQLKNDDRTDNNLLKDEAKSPSDSSRNIQQLRPFEEDKYTSKSPNLKKGYRNETKTKLDFDSTINHTTQTKPDFSPNKVVIPPAKSLPIGNIKPPQTDKSSNAFTHMMQRSAAVFSKSDSKEDVTRQRFHLHNVEGLVTWTSEYDDVSNDDHDDISDKIQGEQKKVTTGNEAIKDEATQTNPSQRKKHSSPTIVPDDVQWSVSITVKKPKPVHLHHTQKQQTHQLTYSPTKQQAEEKALELTISSSIPFPQEGKTQCRLVRRHSRLSVPQLKSCLQKSIRRRAPLPAVRVAMELADKSWGDLVRRLPIIVLEDSTLHPDFPLLVWLMVADSKVWFMLCCFAMCSLFVGLFDILISNLQNYIAPIQLILRVMQIVFEIASCPRQDAVPESETLQHDGAQEMPYSISLSTPSLQLFPKHLSSSCETFIRSMMLRAQYGGMACDVNMLHSFSMLWLMRFRSGLVPDEVEIPFTTNKDKVVSKESGGTKLSLPTTSIYWWEYPELLHMKAREHSEKLVTSKIVSPGGVKHLNMTDVCSAGIDFHCSSVVETLISQPTLIISLREKLAPMEKAGTEMERDWLSRQVKHCIWNYSSGINHRRPIFSVDDLNRSSHKEESVLKAVWNDILKAPFHEYTKNFVRERI